jgi:hypothetical protein
VESGDGGIMNDMFKSVVSLAEIKREMFLFFEENNISYQYVKKHDDMWFVKFYRFLIDALLDLSLLTAAKSNYVFTEFKFIKTREKGHDGEFTVKLVPNKISLNGKFVQSVNVAIKL